jgi:hypothetical protein
MRFRFVSIFSIVNFEEKLKWSYFRRWNSCKRSWNEEEFSKNENYCDFIFEWFKGTDSNVNYCLIFLIIDYLNMTNQYQMSIEEYDYYIVDNFFD